MRDYFPSAIHVFLHFIALRETKIVQIRNISAIRIEQRSLIILMDITSIVKIIPIQAKEWLDVTCIPATGETDEETVALEEVCDDHIDILVLFIPTTSHEAQVLSPRHGACTTSSLGQLVKVSSLFQFFARLISDS